MNVLHSLIVTVYYFVPIWAFLIWVFVKFKGAISLIAIEGVLFFLTMWFAFNPMKLAKISNWFHWYTFFLMAYILILTIKFGYANLNKILALGMWMVFIAGEWWEIPVFIYDGLGWINGFHIWNVTWTQWLSSHIHRAYVFATLILMVKMAKVKLNIKNFLLLFAGTFFSFVGMYPWSTYEPQSTLIHITSLSLFGFIIYFGEPTLDASLVGT